MPKPVKADPNQPDRLDARRPPLMARVWDPVVRLFHWSLVASFALAWFTANRAEAVHIWAGYAASALILLRLVWGIFGSRHARFSSFVTGPRKMFAYIGAILNGSEARHIGHNPAGGAMVLALMTGIAGTAVTGWMMFTDTWYGEDWVVTVHSLIAHGLVVLIVLHLGGVALASVKHQENLVKAMFTGKKRAAEGSDFP